MSWLSEIAPDPANVTLFAAVVGGLPGSKIPFQASQRYAADYIQKLSKAEQQLPHWQCCSGPNHNRSYSWNVPATKPLLAHAQGLVLTR
jgi:hypothetical protein